MRSTDGQIIWVLVDRCKDVGLISVMGSYWRDLSR